MFLTNQEKGIKDSFHLRFNVAKVHGGIGDSVPVLYLDLVFEIGDEVLFLDETFTMKLFAKFAEIEFLRSWDVFRNAISEPFRVGVGFPEITGAFRGVSLVFTVGDWLDPGIQGQSESSDSAK